MQVQLIRRKKNLIVRLKGELDHHSAGIFRESVGKELAKEIHQNLILNLANLTFMDSSGIGVILGRYKQVKDKGGRVIICGLDKHHRRILQLGGLLTIIPAYSGEKQALASLE